WAINPNGTVKWTFEDAGGAGGMPAAGGGQPVALLSDGRIVVAAGHTIWALHADGSVAWSFSWDGGFNNQIDNGPSVGPDGNIYATTALNDGFGLGVFSLTPDGELRWQDEPDPPMFILNASHNQRVRFTQTHLVFGFIATTGAPSVYAYDFDGSQTNFIDYTCLSSPKTDGVDRLLLAGVCGLQAIDLETDSILWSVGLGPVNMLPIAGSDGVVYSGSWHGPVSAIGTQGQVLWTSPSVGLQRTLAVSDQYEMFLYAGENFGEPNWFGAIDTASGQELFSIPFETVDGHNELSWSNEAAFSPDGTVAYYTTRFTSNGAPGQLYAVRFAAGEAACPADLDGSGTVGIEDFLALLALWGPCAGCAADLDGDGAVTITDLLAVLAAWGLCN
ncbi:MAG: PQQ-binding-like beta-propeller repeat protein, partial [Phycisphaerales bacterium]